ncbi:MAG: AAA family ATPase [Spirochaetota bacterium]
MRPQNLDEFAGQEHILGPGRLLRRAIQADLLASIILYGPPGTGKTTLARVIANTTKSRFVTLNAVLSGVKEVRAAIDEAKQNRELYSRKTILFVDEVHRWNKAQQDALLPWVENGTVVLIGATTQNPFFEVNKALVSRSRIFQLKPLTHEDMRAIATRALTDPVRGYGRYEVQIDPDALDHLIQVADGDARGLLGALQLAVETTPERFPPPPETTIHIDRAIAEESIQQRAVLYDKEGDYHYDAISAFIKSIRGSDPDAALYWMARMIYSGEDPHFIFRRMLISASEDIGLADPNALPQVQAAAAAFDRVGLPEGNFFLAQSALYLATTKKSNTTLGFFDALDAVASEPQGEVPNHLRDASRDAEGLGHGKGYLYPHAYRDHWVAQAYLPEKLRGRLFYTPSHQGYEATIADEVERRRELTLDMLLEDGSSEVLTYSADTDRELERWIARAEGERRAALLSLKDTLLAHARLQRHETALLAGPASSLLLFDACRAAPEGRVIAAIADPRRLETLLGYAESLSELAQPLLLPNLTLPGEEPANFNLVLLAEGFLEFRRKVDSSTPDESNRPAPASSPGASSPPDLAATLASRCAANGRLVAFQRVPREGQRLSELLSLPPDFTRALAAAEHSLYEDTTDSLVNWGSDEYVQWLADAGWLEISVERHEVTEKRMVTASLVDRWFDPGRASGLGARLEAVTDPTVRGQIANAVAQALAGRAWPWRSLYLIVSARPPRSV